MTRGFVYLTAEVGWASREALAHRVCHHAGGRERRRCTGRSSIKYEEVHLKVHESVSHGRRSIGDCIELYDRKRPPSSLADQTPDEAYFATLPAIKSAA